MEPFTISHNKANSRIDLSNMLEAPAGKDGWVTIRDGHLWKPSGERLRLWGVNVTDWRPGSAMIPAKEHAPIYAAALASFGINCVRLHFLDLPTPRGIIDSTRDDTQHFDSEQLDRLDFWIAELKRRGIYCDLNIVVGRSYKAGDQVRDYDRIGWAKALTFFDPRLIELQKQYATALLTHYNPYTRSAYRDEPAIVIVELVNENSLVEAWCQGRLEPGEPESDEPNWRPITPYYAAMLDRMYNDYLVRLHSDKLPRLRESSGITDDSPLPRLRPDEFALATTERFQIEAGFYQAIERDYFEQMQTFLTQTVGVKALLLGSNDHNHSYSGYATVSANTVLDIVDGHVYWQHAEQRGSHNTPMVEDPLNSTVVRLSRSAVAGKPYMVSEVNHPYPNDWVCEGIPTLAAYARLQDWDGVIWYTFEPNTDPEAEGAIGIPFDLSMDPMKLPQIAAGSLMFLRGDVGAADTTTERTYTPEQVLESLRMSPSERPYYTRGFPRALALQHRMRIGSFQGPPTELPPARDMNPIRSETEELVWYAPPDYTGLITVDTPCSQALIGYVEVRPDAIRHLVADVSNPFCAITLSSLDAEPIARATRMLLTAGARAENTGQQWNAERTSLINRGGPPSQIEVVRGRLLLRQIESATAVLVSALDGTGNPIGATVAAEYMADEWVIVVGEQVTTWYEITVKR